MSVPNKLFQFAAQSFCRHRRFPPFRWFGQFSYLVSRAYENRNFDINTNGEAWYLRKLQSLPIKCAFDVGANIGEWLQACRQTFPNATIHAFEVVPDTFQKLKQSIGSQPNVIANQFGLSDSEGEIELYLPENADYCATAFRAHLDDAYATGGRPTKTVLGKVRRGDDYVERNKIAAIDVLKIDVEGMEKSVLQGFEKTLSQHKIRLIQFEYNTTNIVSGFLLREAYDFFKKHGYRVGKLYPNYVEFRDFHYRHEDFCGPNMIAVRAGDSEIQQLLS